MAGPVLLAVAAAGNNCLQFQHRLPQVIVDDDVVELVPVRDVAYCIPEAPQDDGFTVGTAVPKAPFQFPERWRQDENGLALGHRLPDLAGALPVDFEDYVAALGKVRLDLGASGAVAVVEYLRRFQEFAFRFQLRELFAGNEEIIAP